MGKSKGSTKHSTNRQLEWLVTGIYTRLGIELWIPQELHEILSSSEGILKMFINLGQSSFEDQSLRGICMKKRFHQDLS